MQLCASEILPAWESVDAFQPDSLLRTLSMRKEKSAFPLRPEVIGMPK